MHELGIRVGAGVGGIQTLLIRQDDECISLHQVGYQCAQRIVVTELDFIVDHRVVFVDHRHHTQLEQRQQG